MNHAGPAAHPAADPGWPTTEIPVVDDESGPPAVDATDLALRYRGRDVFAPVTALVPAGSLAVVSGPSGSGKTALLLTLAGRMRPDGGALAVGGEELPRHAGPVRRRVCLAEMRGVNDLDDSLTVQQHLAERLAMQQPWWKPWVSRPRVTALADDVDQMVRSLSETSASLVTTGRHAPDPATGLSALDRAAFVSDLAPLERTVLGCTLALLGRPDVLVVDDVDGLRSSADRRSAWAGLLAVLAEPPTADDGRPPLTVIASCQDTRELDDLLLHRPQHGVRPPVVRIPLTPPVPDEPPARPTPRDQDEL